MTSPFPGFGSFFTLEDAGATRPYRGVVEDRSLAPFSVLRGDVRLEAPLEIGHFMGGAPGHVIWTGPGAAPLIVDEYVVEALGGFTGWAVHPAIVLEGERALHGYFALLVTGRCGPIDHERGGLVVRKMPGGLFPYQQGFYFDEASWDGSDLFMSSDGTGWVFAHDGVRRAFNRNRIRNIRFTPIREIEMIPDWAWKEDDA